MTDEELKALFEQEARLMAENARVPAAGGIWWRSAMRARADAAEAAMRPFIWFQAVVAAAVLGVLAAVIGKMWPVIKGGAMLQLMGVWTMPLVAILAVGLVVVPVVLYFALNEREKTGDVPQRR